MPDDSLRGGGQRHQRHGRDTPAIAGVCREKSHNSEGGRCDQESEADRSSPPGQAGGHKQQSDTAVRTAAGRGKSCP